MASRVKLRGAIGGMSVKPNKDGGLDGTYRTQAKSAHPDVGGSDEAMAELNAARERVLSEVSS